MSWDYSKLNGKIVEKCGTQTVFAEKIGLSERSVSLKLNGKIGWKQQEIAKACDILDIHKNDIAAYFFYSNSSENINIDKEVRKWRTNLTLQPRKQKISSGNI